MPYVKNKEFTSLIELVTKMKEIILKLKYENKELKKTNFFLINPYGGGTPKERALSITGTAGNGIGVFNELLSEAVVLGFGGETQVIEIDESERRFLCFETGETDEESEEMSDLDDDSGGEEAAARLAAGLD